jgi:hypothetical protein
MLKVSSPARIAIRAGGEQGMAVRNSAGFRLGAEEIAFLRIEHLSILAASHGPENTPFVARAVGYRLAADAARVTIIVSTHDAAELLSQVASNGMIAVVFALPSTHQALQLKGSDAREEKLAKTDVQLVRSYRRAFVGHLVSLGYPGEVFEAMLECDLAGLKAVTFTPTMAFSQTPGPGAGHAIGALK